MSRRWRNLPFRRGDYFYTPVQNSSVVPSYITRDRVSYVKRGAGDFQVVPLTNNSIVQNQSRVRRSVLYNARGSYFNFIPAQIIVVPTFIPYLKRERIAYYKSRKGSYFPIVPAQLVIAPPFIEFVRRSRTKNYSNRSGSYFSSLPVDNSIPEFIKRRKGKLGRPRQGNYFSLVPTQVVVTAPTFVEQLKRSRSKLTVTTRGGTYYSVVPTQQVVQQVQFVDYFKRTRRASELPQRSGSYLDVPTSTQFVGFVTRRRLGIAKSNPGTFFNIITQQVAIAPAFVDWIHRSALRRFGYVSRSKYFWISDGDFAPPVVIVTPASRTYTVPYENRTIVLEFEDRTYVVPFESRTVVSDD